MPKKVDVFPQKLPINKHTSLKKFSPDLGGGLLTVLHNPKDVQIDQGGENFLEKKKFFFLKIFLDEV